MSKPEDLDLPDELADAIFEIELSIPGGGKITHNIRHQLNINSDFLESYFEKGAEYLAMYRIAQAHQRRHVETLERAAQVRRAKLRKQISEAAKAEKGSSFKITDKTLDALTELDEELNVIEADKILAWQNHSILNAVVRSLENRHEALRSLSSLRKSEG